MVNSIKSVSEQLFEAEQSQTTVTPLTTVNPQLTVEEAYATQLENIARKLAAGDRIVGKKIGLTSIAVQQMLGVDEPDYGHLLASMAVKHNATFDTKQLIQPKVEGEVAFVLKDELKGPGITALDVLKATDYIVPAIEIVDSRVEDWKIKLQDTVADNASAARYVLGDKQVPLQDVDLSLVGMVVKKNGVLVNTGVGAAALGNPLTCVAWLANRLADFGIALQAGEVILSGALSGMVEVQAGDTITIKFAHLGEVTVHFD